MREVVCNAMDLHGKVFTVKIPFVVCETRRPLLSLAMLEEKGFHLTVKDGCWKLGGHGREMILRKHGNSYLADVEFRGGLLESKKTTLRGLSCLVAPADSGLPPTACVDERRAVTISTPEMPGREGCGVASIDSHSLCSMASCMHCCKGPTSSTLPPRWSCRNCSCHASRVAWTIFLGLTDTTTGEGTAPTLVLCDGNATVSVSWFQGNVLCHMLSEVFVKSWSTRE